VLLRGTLEEHGGGGGSTVLYKGTYVINQFRVVKMPRQARNESSTGIYHVILRGINRQIIFEDAEDNNKIVNILNKYRTICGYRLFAYCLMGNHIHLLLKIEKDNIDLIIKRIAGSYVYWYNLKYNRIGHLFQDRYKSEAVENDRYLLTVLRYIHQNPRKAGLCKKISEYEYSSYGDYIKGESNLLDVGFIYSIIDKESFVAFSEENYETKCLEISDINYRINDIDAMEIIKKITHCGSSSEFQQLKTECRNLYIRQLKAERLSIRQISRLTGISFGIVRKM